MTFSPSHAPAVVATGKRGFFEAGRVRLSYVDFGGAPDAPVLAALHGHFGCARNFAPLAEALRPLGWRVAALDQRGHGWSDRPEACGREDYIRDAEQFVLRIGGGRPVVLLGHSLGGVNAYQVAARRKDLVGALIVEDIGARIEPVAPLGLDWPRAFPSLSHALAFLDSRGFAGDRYFLDSLHETESGWAFRFDPAWMARSQAALTGDWSVDWTASDCPCLLLHGRKSWAVGAGEIERMARIRPGTRVVAFDCGHTIHDELSGDFAAAVALFLSQLPGHPVHDPAAC